MSRSIKSLLLIGLIITLNSCTNENPKMRSPKMSSVAVQIHEMYEKQAPKSELQSNHVLSYLDLEYSFVVDGKTYEGSDTVHVTEKRKLFVAYLYRDGMTGTVKALYEVGTPENNHLYRR